MWAFILRGFTNVFPQYWQSSVSWRWLLNVFRLSSLLQIRQIKFLGSHCKYWHWCNDWSFFVAKTVSQYLHAIFPARLLILWLQPDFFDSKELESFFLRSGLGIRFVSALVSEAESWTLLSSLSSDSALDDHRPSKVRDAAILNEDLVSSILILGSSLNWISSLVSTNETLKGSSSLVSPWA